jgi:O-antigen/teichoic acid export membrane protein
MKRTRAMINELNASLRRSGSFVQNSAWMFASSGISILIQFVFFTILARIYSPAVYGIFGVFNVYVSTLGNAATLGYNQAFVLPRSEREFSALLRLTCWTALILSAAVMAISLIAGKQIISSFGHGEMGNWVYLVAPAMLLLALDRITADWAIRNKEFRKQTLWSISTTLMVKSFNVWYGAYISATTAGLVYTTLLQHVLRVFFYSWFIIHDFTQKMKDRFHWKELKAVARKYKEYPLYIYWGNVINIFSNNLPAAMLPALGFGMNYVGYYTYSLIVLDLPIRMLGAGVSSVFLQKAAEISDQRSEELPGHTWKLFKGIFWISIVFSFLIFLTGEWVYVTLLDDKWREAGQLAEILVIFYFFRMISSPISSLYNVLRKEKEFFMFQLVLTICRFGSLVAGSIYTSDFLELMLIYSLVNAFIYLLFCIRIFQLIHFRMSSVIAYTAGWVTVISALAILIKYYLLQ